MFRFKKYWFLSYRCPDDKSNLHSGNLWIQSKGDLDIGDAKNYAEKTWNLKGPVTITSIDRITRKQYLELTKNAGLITGS